MPIKTPICDFGQAAKSFELKSTNNEIIKLDDVKGENGTLIMFICNHCPYVKAVIKDIVEDCKNLEEIGVKSLAICSNDSINYPEDSFDKMKEFSKDNNFSFPYLLDETQEVAKAYDAACTPDFYLYDSNLKLVYRGQLDNSRPGNDIESDGSDMKNAIQCLIDGIENKELQKPSIGCNIKWK